MTDLRLDKFAPHVFSTKDLCEKAYGIGKCARINHIDGWSPSGQELIPANEEINWNKHRYEPCEDDFVCAAVQGGGLEGSGPEGSGSGAEDNTCPEVDIPINKYVKNIWFGEGLKSYFKIDYIILKIKRKYT